jgi:hypothetical protein
MGFGHQKNQLKSWLQNVVVQGRNDNRCEVSIAARSVSSRPMRIKLPKGT